MVVVGAFPDPPTRQGTEVDRGDRKTIAFPCPGAFGVQPAQGELASGAWDRGYTAAG